MKLNRNAAFSLVEVTLALGIAAFALVAILGLLPVGLSGAQRATEQTTATQVALDIGDDLLTPGIIDESPRFKITIPDSTTEITNTFYLSQATVVPPAADGASAYVGYARQGTSTGARYGVEVKWKISAKFPNVRTGSVTVWWPGSGTKANASGKVLTSVAVNQMPF